MPIVALAHCPVKTRDGNRGVELSGVFRRTKQEAYLVALGLKAVRQEFPSL